MRSTKRIHHEHIAQGGDFLSQFRLVVFFTRVETNVFTQHDFARCYIDTFQPIGHEANRHAQQAGKMRRHGLQCELRIELTFDEPVDAAGFTAEDVTLTGPSGEITPLSVTPLAADRFAVTFSPVRPSPRVAARTRRPSSYVSAIDEPSILNSHTYAQGRSPIASLVRLSHASSSLTSMALSSEYMR